MAGAAPEQNLFKLYPNPFQIYLSVHMRQGNVNGVHDSEVETLEWFCENDGILNHLSVTHKGEILKQLIQCLRRQHQHSITCPQLSPYEISLLRSQLPWEEHIPDRNRRINDRNSLANIYCSVLTNRRWRAYSEELPMEDIQCSDPDIALDILRVLTNENSTPNIEDVFRHPFYWSNFTKVYFICSTVEYINSHIINSTRDEKISILEGFHMHIERDVIPDGNWMAALKLTRQEIRRGNENNGNVEIGDNVIINIAHKGNPVGNSVFELMRFFRNRYIHHMEDRDDIRNAFGGYPSGYLKFFTSRFPNFFMHVYHKMEDWLCQENNEGEFFSH